MGEAHKGERRGAAARWWLPLASSIVIVTGAATLTAGLVIAHASGNVTAGELAVFGKLMKDIEFDMNEMQTTIVFEEADPALAYAVSLLEKFGSVENFFVARDNADAVAWSREYKGLAVGIASHIEAGQFDEAYNLSLEFAEDCEVCHEAYRPL